MSQISSGFDSYSSKRSSPKCLKYFPWEYFYRAKMKAGALWECRASTAKLLLHPAQGRVQASSLGIRHKRIRVGLLYRRELEISWQRP